MNNWVKIAAATMAVSLTTVAWAGPGMCGGRQGPHEAMRGLNQVLRDSALAEELGVTQEQVTELNDAIYKFKQNIVRIRSEHELAKIEITRLMMQDEPDTEAVMKAVEQAGQIDTNMKKACIEQRMKIKSVLGKETLAKIHDHFAKKDEEMGSPCGGRRFGPGGSSGGFRGGPGGCGPRGEANPQEDILMEDQMGSLPQLQDPRAQGIQPRWMDDQMNPPAPNEMFSFDS